MKTSITTILCLAIAGTMAAHAEGEKKHRKIPKEVLERFDTDGDGQLSEAERAAMKEALGDRREERRAEILKRFDTDGDGKLSEEEREAMKEAMKAKREEIIAKYDTDGDGKLNEEERAAARADGVRIPDHKPRPRKERKVGE